VCLLLSAAYLDGAVAGADPLGIAGAGVTGDGITGGGVTGTGFFDDLENCCNTELPEDAAVVF
jgi:hypothetical protein